jgi:hypothetical protein
MSSISSFMIDVTQGSALVRRSIAVTTTATTGRSKVLHAAVVVAVLAALPIASHAQSSSAERRVYVAELRPMNAETAGHETMGNAQFTIEGDRLTIEIDVEGAPPGIVHWQHFHGFKDGREARCPTEAADKNGDHVVDLLETETASGTTMVPFDENPAAMDVAHGTYPKASATGSYTYTETVSLSELGNAVSKAFDGAKVDLARRVVFVHGVAPETKLPSSVASLGPIPAYVTLPIACGEIDEVAE